ncbi:hypothetical protein ACQ4PT_067868 [Festuca glaucescens]
MEAKVPEDVEENVLQPPDWLPNGWVMEVKCGEDGTPYQYFVSPTSGSKFRMKAEVLNYLFAEMDEHWIQSKEKAACSSMLPKAHGWLPKGWLVEIRAGGENMDKMFKAMYNVCVPRRGWSLTLDVKVIILVNGLLVWVLWASPMWH